MSNPNFSWSDEQVAARPAAAAPDRFRWADESKPNGPKPNAGLAPPAGPSKEMDSGEGPIAAGLTSFETQLAGTPGRIARYLRHPFRSDAEYEAESKKPVLSQLGDVAQRLNPIAKIDQGTPNEQIDWGATGANLAPLLIDVKGRGIAESPAGQLTRIAARPTVRAFQQGLGRPSTPPIAPELTTEARTLPGQIPPERISPEPKAEIIPPVRRGLALPERTPSTIEAAVKSPSRTLPGQIAPETVQPEVLPGVAGARPSLHRITPSRGLALPPGGEPPVEVSPAAPRSPSQTAMAFRARSAGEQGIPHNAESPAQATMSQPEAEGFLGGREDVTGEPQELVGVDLGEAPGFSTRPGPSGNDWVKFHGDVPETAIQPISAAKPSAVSPELLGQQLNDALGGRPLEPGVPLRQQISKIGKPSAPIKTAPLTNLADEIKESAPPSQAPTMAPLGDLGAEIKSSAIELPEGFTATPDSSVLAGYKYNPEAREFEAITNRGDHYVHSDVSPEEAAKFEAADSKGSAWNQLKKGPGVTLTKSGPVGKLEPVKPGTLKTSKGVIAKSNAGMNPDADPNADLTPKLKASVRKVEAEKRARARAQ